MKRKKFVGSKLIIICFAFFFVKLKITVTAVSLNATHFKMIHGQLKGEKKNYASIAFMKKKQKK